MPPAPEFPGPAMAPGQTPSRPQADFSAPIDIAASDETREPGVVGDDPEPTQHGGYVPPLFAMADDNAEPQTPQPPPNRPLTERISQGRPSYSEPDPHIAGTVGRVANPTTRRKPEPG